LPASRDAVSGRIAPRPGSRFRRWALRLFVSHLLLAVVTMIVLVVTITDQNAGYPALFFAGLLAALSFPVWIATIVLAAVSLVRREPRPLISVGLLAICALLALAVAPIALNILKGIAGGFG